MQIGLQARAEAVFDEKALSMLLISLITNFDKRASADARKHFASSC
jgi:Cdc6-like AAA superfamily ATPase